MEFSLRSGNNEVYFIRRTWYLLGCVSAPIGMVFLKPHTTHFPCMYYKRWKFGCYRLVLKGTLLGKQSTFSAAFRLLSERCSWNFILRTLRSCATNSVSLITMRSMALYLENKVPFLGCITLSIEGSFWNFIPRNFHPCATHGAVSVLIGQ